MNIETLKHYADSFNEQVIESGFRRDVTDYVASAPTNRGNIVSLKQMAVTVYEQLERIHSSDLPNALDLLLANAKPVPFTERDYATQFKDLLENKTVQQEEFFATLHGMLTKLNSDLDSNAKEVSRIEDFVDPYVARQGQVLADSKEAVFAIIFKDEKTTHRLAELTKTLSFWNKILPLYHQLVTNTSPRPIELIEVQNGSIDVIVNLDVKVAADLAALFRIALIAFNAYLLQKKLLLPMAEGYFGNQKARELDEQKEQVLLENIRDSVAHKAEEQYAESHKKGAKADNPDKIVEQVASLVTSHVVRGNEVKILALPKAEGAASEVAAAAGTAASESDELKRASSKVRLTLKDIPRDQLTLLLDYYGEANVTVDGDKSASHKGKRTKGKEVST